MASHRVEKHTDDCVQRLRTMVTQELTAILCSQSQTQDLASHPPDRGADPCCQRLPGPVRDCFTDIDGLHRSVR